LDVLIGLLIPVGLAALLGYYFGSLPLIFLVLRYVAKYCVRNIFLAPIFMPVSVLLLVAFLSPAVLGGEGFALIGPWWVQAAMGAKVHIFFSVANIIKAVSLLAAIIFLRELRAFKKGHGK